ncbi:MAG: RluA family pseudouridine synthase [Prevotellaceae bacterium]|jgi:23S rRNA pseudouridine1911/1915/1917 synthase|nr:RluA family pseudouridine synthase [Prevotellaceae bacterium]
MKNNNFQNKNAGKTHFRITEKVELMDFLLKKMGGMSRNSVKSLLAHRQISVNGKIMTLYNHQLIENDRVVVSSARGNVELAHPKLRILFEDQYIIVVEKKHGLLTVSTSKGDEITAFSILKNYVKKQSPQNRIFVVHRLDRDTSGVLVFAKQRETQLALQENWHTNVRQRTYFAVVEGVMPQKEDTVVSWLTENPKSLKIHSSEMDNGGQKAVTHYKSMKSNEKFSLLEINLETGRKNLIRVHLQESGQSVVGDKKYGATTNPLGRLALHAKILEFFHPVSHNVVRFESPVPKEFMRVINGKM